MAQAGRLDRRITIEKPVSTSQAPSGQLVVQHDHVDTAWAAIESVSGRERFVDEQIAAEVDTVFVMRWRDDITPECRIVADGRNYDVKRAVELRFWQGIALGRRQMLAALATARAE